MPNDIVDKHLEELGYEDDTSKVHKYLKSTNVHPFISMYYAIYITNSLGCVEQADGRQPSQSLKQ